MVKNCIIRVALMVTKETIASDQCTLDPHSTGVDGDFTETAWERVKDLCIQDIVIMDEDDVQAITAATNNLNGSVQCLLLLSREDLAKRLSQKDNNIIKQPYPISNEKDPTSSEHGTAPVKIAGLHDQDTSKITAIALMGGNSDSHGQRIKGTCISNFSSNRSTSDQFKKTRSLNSAAAGVVFEMLVDKNMAHAYFVQGASHVLERRDVPADPQERQEFGLKLLMFTNRKESTETILRQYKNNYDTPNKIKTDITKMTLIKKRKVDAIDNDSDDKENEDGQSQHAKKPCPTAINVTVRKRSTLVHEGTTGSRAQDSRYDSDPFNDEEDDVPNPDDEDFV